MPQRGEVWWVRLDPSLGSELRKTRPCLVVGTNAMNARRRTVVVVPLSNSPQAGPPLLIPLVCAGRKSVAVLDQVRAVSRERLERVMGMISREEMLAVEDGLRQILELG
jgi:mRNA interferase MazF